MHNEEVELMQSLERKKVNQNVFVLFKGREINEPKIDKMNF